MILAIQTPYVQIQKIRRLAKKVAKQRQEQVKEIAEKVKNIAKEDIKLLKH